MDHQPIFAFLAERLSAGQPCVLITVLAVEGSAMRGPGTHMAVAGDGSFAGSLSGGCIEAAVVAEACAALAEQRPRIVRFGAGSPYLDIRLPCGGGLDIHFQPLTDPALPMAALAAIAARQPFSLMLEAGTMQFQPGWQAAAYDAALGMGNFGHWPALRLALVGHGASMAALTRLAGSLEIGVDALSPDPQVIADLTALGIAAQHLARTTDTATLTSDRWTAIVFLFHDHDWELALLQRALDLPHCYIGAMGGRRAHAARCSALAAAGVSSAAIASIHAPIGLFHSSRDPETLALSALAEVVRVYQASDFSAGA